MNAILSIIVCFAMLFSGGATLPAQPETATVWTLRNLSFTTDEGSVTLNPELRLTTAIGTESARMQFGIIDGDEVLMPIAGEITPDCLRFTMGNSGSVYTLTNEALMDAMEGDEMSLKAFDYMADYMDSYAAMMTRSMSDADFQWQLNDVAIDLLIRSCGATPEPVTVEIDGQQLSAQRVHLDITPDAMRDMLKGVASCGIPEIEDMATSYVLMSGAMLGGDFDSVDACIDFIFEEMEADDGMNATCPMDLVYISGSELTYMDMKMDAMPGYAEPGCSASMQTTTLQIPSDDGLRAEMSMSFTLDENGDVSQMDFSMTENVVGPVDDPQSAELHAELTMKDSWAIQVTDVDVHPSSDYMANDEVRLVLDMSATIEDGLEHSTLDISGDILSTTAFDGEESVDTDSYLRMHITSDDRSEEDGSVTAAVVIDLECDGEAGVISYELNCTEGAPVPEFDESKTVDLMKLMESEEFDPAILGFAADTSLISSHASRLSTEESVIAMGELLGDGEDEAEYGYDEPVVVDSIDAAMEIFGGDTIGFDLPEDLVADEIFATGDYMNAYYVSEDVGRSVSLYFRVSYSDSSYYAYQDGQLNPAASVVDVSTIDEECGMYNISMSRANDCCYFYLYGFTPEEVDALLASLEF